MNLKNIKKLLSLVSIISLLVVGGILISAIFGANVFKGFFLKIILTCALLTAVSTFSLSALTYIKKKFILSVANLSLLCVLAICGLVIIWFSLFGVFGQITLTLAIATGLVGICNANVIKLGKKYFTFQIISFVIIAIADVLLTLVVWNLLPWNKGGIAQWFTVSMVVAFIDICILSVLARKNVGEEKEEVKTQQTLSANEDEIVIKKQEYEDMKNRIEQLEKELNEYKIKNLESQVEMLKNNNNENNEK